MLHAYHKCCTNGTCNVFMWQSARKHQIIWIKKMKPVLLKNKLKKEYILTLSYTSWSVGWSFYIHIIYIMLMNQSNLYHVYGGHEIYFIIKRPGQKLATPHALW